jgi:hypothetical protein
MDPAAAIALVSTTGQMAFHMMGNGACEPTGPCAFFMALVGPLSNYNKVDPEYVPPDRKYDSAYWAQCLKYGNSQFKSHFRLTRDSFNKLCSELRPPSTKNAYDFDFKVGLFLWRMATQESCRQLAERFSISKSCVSSITKKVARLIVAKLTKKYVKFPFERWEKFAIATRWEDKTEFPNVIGAIDGTHIKMHKRPNVEHPEIYFDRKSRYSVLAQAVVNDMGIFLDFEMGWPGRTHDARAFDESQFSLAMDDHLVSLKDEGLTDSWYVLGDSAYSQTEWMMKPYPALDPEEEGEKLTYNIYHARARVAVENAFGRLKQRWRRLFNVDCDSIETVVEWTHACMLLHNFCEMNEDLLEESEVERMKVWLEEEKKDDEKWQHLGEIEESQMEEDNIGEEGGRSAVERRRQRGKRIRDKVANHLWYKHTEKVRREQMRRC